MSNPVSTSLYPDDHKYPSGEYEVGLKGGKFTSGDPASGSLPSRLPASHLNLLTDLLQTAIEGAGLTANNTDSGQLSLAILKRIQQNAPQLYTFDHNPTASDDSSKSYKNGDRWVNSVTHESYVLLDATIGAAVWTDTTLTLDEITPLLNQKVSKAGDTMTGPLTLSGPPVADNQAATKKYVDATILAVSGKSRAEIFSLGSAIDIQALKDAKVALPCDGTEYAKSDYTALWEALKYENEHNGGKYTLTDVAFHTPDLNGFGAFLRGKGGEAGPAGALQSDDFKEHDHSTVSQGVTFSKVLGVGIENDSVLTQPGGYDQEWRINGGNGLAEAFSMAKKGGTETRPKNFSVYWMIKT